LDAAEAAKKAIQGGRGQRREEARTRGGQRRCVSIDAPGPTARGEEPVDLRHRRDSERINH